MCDGEGGLQVSFHDRKAVRKTRVEKRNNDIVSRLNRTKREENPDLAARRDAHDQVQPPAAVPACLQGVVDTLQQAGCRWSIWTRQ